MKGNLMKAKYHDFLMVLVVPLIFFACNGNVQDAEFHVANAVVIPSGDVEVFRTVMPDAGPSSFAIRFKSANLALCYDPVRGGINYVWKGGFNLEPTITGKIGKPALIDGEPFYREKEWHPLRTSKMRGNPAYRFKGYSLTEDTLEFRYSIDGGMNIRERITATVEGGIRRDFEVERNDDSPENLYLHIEPQVAAMVVVDGAEILEEEWAVFGDEPLRNFSVTIRERKEGEL